MLCRELGYTLKDLLDSLGEGELALWLEHQKKWPLGNTWLQTGTICSTIAGFAGKIAKTELPPIRFIPIHREPPPPQNLYHKMLWGLVGAGSRLVDKDGNPIELSAALTR